MDYKEQREFLEKNVKRLNEVLSMKLGIKVYLQLEEKKIGVVVSIIIYMITLISVICVVLQNLHLKQLLLVVGEFIGKMMRL